jgi:hypothetical protein
MYNSSSFLTYPVLNKVCCSGIYIEVLLSLTKTMNFHKHRRTLHVAMAAKGREERGCGGCRLELLIPKVLPPPNILTTLIGAIKFSRP